MVVMQVVVIKMADCDEIMVEVVEILIRWWRMGFILEVVKEVVVIEVGMRVEVWGKR